MASSLKPVPSLQQKLILDQSLTCGTETCSTDHFLSDAKLAEPPVNLVREGSVLAPVELQEAAPFLVSEVSPSDHAKYLSVERIDDSTILSFAGIEQPILAVQISRASSVLGGPPPLDYMLRWWMGLARDLLRHENSVRAQLHGLAIRLKVRFANAFKRIYGRAPKR